MAKIVLVRWVKYMLLPFVKHSIFCKAALGVPILTVMIVNEKTRVLYIER